MEGFLIEGISKSDLESLIEEKLREVLTEHLQSNYKKPSANNTYLTRKEASRLLRISLVTLDKLTSTGRLKSYRVGKKVLFKRNEIDDVVIPIKH
jgi:excisionase family DNA binding protein